MSDKNYKGETPLHLAAFTGNIAIVELLLQHHADIEARDLYLITNSLFYFFPVSKSHNLFVLLVNSTRC